MIPGTLRIGGSVSISLKHPISALCSSPNLVIFTLTAFYLSISCSVFLQPVASLAVSNDLTVPVYTQEPPPVYQLLDNEEKEITCAVKDDLNANISWRYEKVNDNSLSKIITRGWVHNISMHSIPPVIDKGKGRLVIPTRRSADGDDILTYTPVSTTYRFYCEAKSLKSQFVSQSRKVVIKRSKNLKECTPLFTCYAGWLNGSVVCKMSTDPHRGLVEEYFDVTYLRKRDPYTNHEEYLTYNEKNPKYVIFSSGYHALHIVNFAEEDTEFNYYARIRLKGTSIDINTSKPEKLRKLTTDPMLEASNTIEFKTAYEYSNNLTVLLPCYNIPSTEYQWFKDGQRIVFSKENNFNYKYTFVSANSGNLKIKTTNEKDAGKYTCKLLGVLLSTINLEIYKPLATNISNNPVSVDYGGNASIDCELSGTHIKKVSWLRNGIELTSSSRIQLPDEKEMIRNRRGTLRIIKVQLEDQGSYQCLVERNSLLEQETNVPNDNAQSTAELNIKKMPPILKSRYPDRDYIYVKTEDIYTRKPMNTMFCIFEAYPRPEFKFFLDNESKLLEEINFHTGHTEEGKGFKAYINYTINNVMQTGTFVIEAKNDYGSQRCTFTMYTHSALLQIRELQPTYYAVANKYFQLTCHVVGGLNKKLEIENKVNSTYFAQNMYNMEWKLTKESDPTEQLTMPINHRFQEDIPDVLQNKEVMKEDSGTYQCIATRVKTGQSGSGDKASKSTIVKVVSGPTVKKVNDQLKMEKDHFITDTCQPVNKPDGYWYAWWEFTGAGSSTTRVLEPNSGDSGVEYITIQPGNEPGQCPQEQLTVFDSEGLPLFFRSSYPDLKNRAVQLKISTEKNLKYEGNFTCKIVSCYDSDQQTKEVTFKKAYVFQDNKPPNQLDVILGASLYVECALTQTGSDIPSVSWYEGNSMTNEKRITKFEEARENNRVLQFSNGTLYISKIMRTDTKFLCATEIKESQGTLKSTTFNPNIHLPAMVRPFSPKIVEMEVGKSQSISCDFEGETPVSVVWMGNYKAMNNQECRFKETGHYSSQYDYYSGLQHCDSRNNYNHNLECDIQADIQMQKYTLHFKNVCESFKGRYTCQASNVYNAKLASLANQSNISSESFQVEVIKRPGKVEALKETETTENSITLQWDAPKDNGNKKLLYYILNYTDVHNKVISNQNITPESKRLSIQNLQPGFEYTFQIAAANAVGIGEFVSLKHSTKERIPTGTVQNLKVEATGPTQIRIVWKPPELLKQNGIIRSYTVKYRMKAKEGQPCHSDPASFIEAAVCSGRNATLGKNDDTWTISKHNAIACEKPHIDLKAFSEYQVQVIPSNRAGKGPGECSNVRTMESTPREPPMQVKCSTLGSQDISVSWEAPPVGSINGVIQDYEVQYLLADKALYQDEKEEKEKTTNKLNIVIRGLQIYKNYSFTVTVANSKGRSVKSKQVFCKTNAGEPMPPNDEDIKIVQVNATALAVSWKHPQKPNGIMTRYDLEYMPAEQNGSNNQVKYLPVNHNPNNFYNMEIIGKLERHTSYAIRIRSVNNEMSGEFSRKKVEMTMDNPQIKIATYGHTYLVSKGSDLTLDCIIFGDDKSTIWTNLNAPLKSSFKVLSNGSLVVNNIQEKTRYECSTKHKQELIEYTIEVIVSSIESIPNKPKLMAGQITNRSLEVTWKSSGIGTSALDGSSKIVNYVLNYTNHYTNSMIARTLSHVNRSFLVDPVHCGAKFSFTIRAINGHGLTSELSDQINMKAIGDQPIGSPSNLLLQKRYRDVAEFNFSTIQSGSGCQALKYYIYHKSSQDQQLFVFKDPPIVVHRDELVHGCCYNLTTNLYPGTHYQFSVVAHNAAGNTSMNGTFYTLTYQGEKPLQSRNIPGSEAMDVLRLEIIIPLLVALIIVLGIIGFFLYYRRTTYRQQLESQIPVYHQQTLHAHDIVEGGGRKVSMVLRNGIPVETKTITDTRTLTQLLGGEKYNDESDMDDDRASVDSKGNIRAYATFDSTAHGSQPRDLESVREGRTRLARKMQGPTHTRSRSTKRSIPYENDSTLSSDRRVSSLGDLSSVNGGNVSTSHKYSKGYSVAGPSNPRSPAERKEFRMQRDYKEFRGYHPQIKDNRNSHMSSVTTLSSNHEELLAAYSFSQRNAHHPTHMPPADYEENSGSSETTDPGIKQFTNRPPDPNELRNATCEVPFYHPNNQRPRRLGTQMSVETDQTYESIDDFARSTMRSYPNRRDPQPRTGTLPAPPQNRRGSFKRHNSRTTSEAESYGTGVYESADVYSGSYAYGTQSMSRTRKAPSSIYNSYRPSQKYSAYSGYTHGYRPYGGAPEHSGLVNPRGQQLYSPPREERENEEVQSLLVQRQFLPRQRTAPAEINAEAAAVAVPDEDDDDSEDEETYTDTFTVV